MKSLCMICTLFLLVPDFLYAQHSTMPATPLKTLLAEAEAQNSQIASADLGWKASTYVARQATSLPDPQFSVQTLSVGSPVPFAGFSNSDFAYIGFGASQDLPYPGKRKLKGDVADREAQTQKSNALVVRSSVAEQVKIAVSAARLFGRSTRHSSSDGRSAAVDDQGRAVPLLPWSRQPVRCDKSAVGAHQDSPRSDHASRRGGTVASRFETTPPSTARFPRHRGRAAYAHFLPAKSV